MIAVAGLSPAWQQLLVLNRLDTGEVNRIVASHWFASGKPINVASMLACVHASHVVVTPVGGSVGDCVLRDCESRGIEICPIRIAASTRVCTTLVESNGIVTELVPEAPAMTAAEVADFESAFRNALSTAKAIVLIGSFPSGVDAGMYANLLAGVKAPSVVDARGEALRSSLRGRPTIVKPNRAELAATTGKTIDCDADIFNAARMLIDGGARNVVVSDGPGKVHWIDDGHWWEATPPRVAARNPIGSGDYLAGGLAWGLTRNWPMTETFRTAIAAASANAASLLWGNFDEDQLRQMAAEIPLQRRA